MTQRPVSAPAADAAPTATPEHFELDDALRCAAARAADVVSAPAAAATVMDGAIERVEGDRVAVALLGPAILGADSDGVVAGASHASDGGDPGAWTRVAYRAGAGRRVGVVVGCGSLGELAVTRLEAIGLDLARAVLLAEERLRTERLDRLLATARQVAESLDLETVLTSIVRDATTLLGADSGDMLLWDRDDDVLRVVAVWNFPPEMLGFELAFGEGVSTQAIQAGRTIEVPDYRTYEHRARALDVYDFGAVLCAPLVVRGDAIGAINLHARAARRGFASGAGEVLAAFAGHAAIAIDHARRYENEVRLATTLAEANDEMARSLTVQQRLAEQVLLGTGLPGIATALAEHLGRRVVIQDELHRLVAGAAPDAGDGWRALLEDPDAADGRPRPGGDAFAIAIRVGADVAGHLLLSSDADLGPIDRALVDVATTGVALEFAKQRAAAEVEERLRGEAIADLLSGAYTNEDAIAGRAARLGHDLAQPHDLLVIDVAPILDGDAADGIAGAGQTEADGDRDRRRRAFQVIRERLTVRAPRSLVAQHLGSIVVLAGASRRAVDARALAEELRSALDGAVGHGCTTVVIGDRCDRPDEYAPAFRLARDVLDLLVRLGRRGGVVAAGELGPYGLLLRASSRDDLEAFANRSLAPLIEHDRAHGGELVATLRAYLEEDRVQRRVAARCFIHVNTVVYRVRRIEELLGVDLADPSVVFDLTLALRIRDLLADPPPGPRPPARAAPASRP
jgi:sugar diacid utilization regulator